MAKQLQVCVECGYMRENCVQKRDGSWHCVECLREAWNQTKRRIIYRSQLAANMRRRSKTR